MSNKEGRRLKASVLIDHENLNLWQYKILMSIVESQNYQISTLFYRQDLKKKYRRPGAYNRFRDFLNDIIYFNADFLKNINLEEQIQVAKIAHLSIDVIEVDAEADFKQKLQSTKTDILINLSTSALSANLFSKQIYFLFESRNTIIVNLQKTIASLESEIKISLVQAENGKVSVLKSGFVLKKEHSPSETINSCGLMTQDWLPTVFPTKPQARYQVDERKVIKPVENKIFDILLIIHAIFFSKVGHFANRIKNAFTYQQWNIAKLSLNLEGLLANPSLLKREWLFKVDWPKSYADPFLFQLQNQFFLVYEDFDFKQYAGKISIQELATSGVVKKEFKKTISFESRSHFSYPFIFFDQKKIYMIPENVSSKKIIAYELNAETFEIISSVVLLEGDTFVDPTVCFHEDRYWIFCGKWDIHFHGSSKLYVYSSDQFAGPYVPHSLNPVVADMKTARPAGALFQHHNQLYRPSQNCLGNYGKELNIFKVKKLNLNEYEEELVQIIKPEEEYSAGCHHLSIWNEQIVIDGRKEKISFKPFYWKLKNVLTRKNPEKDAV